MWETLIGFVGVILGAIIGAVLTTRGARAVVREQIYQAGFDRKISQADGVRVAARRLGYHLEYRHEHGSGVWHWGNPPRLSDAGEAGEELREAILKAKPELPEPFWSEAATIREEMGFFLRGWFEQRKEGGLAPRSMPDFKKALDKLANDAAILAANLQKERYPNG